MGSFFKTLGQGVLYIVGLPFIIVFLALYAVYCLLVLIYMIFRTIFIYFAGGSPFKDLAEDVKAKKILFARANGTINNQTTNTNSTVNNNQTTNTHNNSTTINYFKIDSSNSTTLEDMQKIKDLISKNTPIIDAENEENKQLENFDNNKQIEYQPEDNNINNDAVKRPDNLDDFEVQIEDDESDD